LLATGVPGGVASRTHRGGTSTRHYAYPGSEVDLLEAGAVMAGLLPAARARLLPQALLADGAGALRVREGLGTDAACAPAPAHGRRAAPAQRHRQNGCPAGSTHTRKLPEAEGWCSCTAAPSASARGSAASMSETAKARWNCWG